MGTTMNELTIKILEDLDIPWDHIIDVPGTERRPAIFNGDFIEAFITLGSYEKLSEKFGIHIETVASIVDKLFPDKGQIGIVNSTIWF